MPQFRLTSRTARPDLVVSRPAVAHGLTGAIGLVGLAACGLGIVEGTQGPAAPPVAGSEGGACYGNGTCDGMLTCNQSSVCVVPGTADDPCANVGCTSHGQCVAGDEGPVCDCDDGFRSVGLACLPDLPCVDGDGDGHGLGCPGGNDCDDDDPNNWVACETCIDHDTDGAFVGCDAYTTVAGPDCDDEDIAVWPDCDAPSPCADVTCSGHGQCVPAGLNATCQCDEGYSPQGLACTPNPACSDGQDNDDDGQIDFPNDPGCDAASDASEQNALTGVLLEETFEDGDFAGRDWHDNTDLVLSTAEHIDGSASSAEFRFLANASTPTSAEH